MLSKAVGVSELLVSSKSGLYEAKIKPRELTIIYSLGPKVLCGLRLLFTFQNLLMFASVQAVYFLLARKNRKM